MIDVPEDNYRPRHRNICAHCEATPAGCDSNFWLRGARCCRKCGGDHDQEASQ